LDLITESRAYIEDFKTLEHEPMNIKKTNIITVICLKIVYILSCFLLAYISTAQALSFSTPPISHKGIWQIGLDTGYYHTEGNYSQFNQAQHLRNVLSIGNTQGSPFFQYMDMNFYVGYTAIKWFEIKIFTNGFWFSQSGDGNNLKFSSLYLQRAGSKLRFKTDFSKYFGIIPEVNFSIPFVFTQSIMAYQNQINQPITDEGSIHIIPGIWLYAVLADVIYPFSYVGFKFRTQALSSLVKWKAGIMFSAEMAEMGAYTYGFWTAIKDTSLFSQSDRMAFLKKVNAGSLKFLSHNPGLIGFGAWLGWNFPYFTLRLSGDIDINGTRYSKGYSFLISLIFNMAYDNKKENNFFNKKTKHFIPNTSKAEKTAEEVFETKDQDLIQKEVEKALEYIEKSEENKMIN